MKVYAGDLEPGDRLTSGQVLPQAMGFGGFTSIVLGHDATVSSVAEEHEYDPSRVMVRTMDGLTLDMHRTMIVRVVGA